MVLSQNPGSPRVIAVQAIPAAGQVALIFEGLIFGGDVPEGSLVALTTRTRHEHVEVHLGLFDLLAELLETGQIHHAVLSGIGKPLVLLGILSPLHQEAAQVQIRLYDALTQMVNYMRRLTGDEEELPQTPYRMAELTSLDDPQRVLYTDALAQARQEVLAALMEAVNAALAHPAQ